MSKSSSESTGSHTSTLVLRAASFAARKHRNQRRKGLDASPYINHCLRVAEIVAVVGDVADQEVIAAAVLHDTIEDTETSGEELEGAFGNRIRRLVEEVTDDKRKNPVERKRLQIEHAPHLSSDAVLIKLADKISNIDEIAANPPADWPVQRRLEYLTWAEAVVRNCVPTSERLSIAFDQSVARARIAIGADQ